MGVEPKSAFALDHALEVFRISEVIDIAVRRNIFTEGLSRFALESEVNVVRPGKVLMPAERVGLFPGQDQKIVVGRFGGGQRVVMLVLETERPRIVFVQVVVKIAE